MNNIKLIILSGPSCVGKTPLIKAYNKLYPEQVANLKKIVLYNSRLPRTYEISGVDYYFRKRKEIEELRKKDNFIVSEIRDDLQALDTNQLLKQLEISDVFYEGNTFMAKILLRHPVLKNIKKISIFLSPFSKDELIQLKSDFDTYELQNYIFEKMKTKLIDRAKKLKQELTEEVLENIEKRAADTFPELKEAWLYDFVIPNHDGEESENWNEPIPTDTDAFLALKEFADLLKDGNQQISEKWQKIF